MRRLAVTGVGMRNVGPMRGNNGPAEQIASKAADRHLGPVLDDHDSAPKDPDAEHLLILGPLLGCVQVSVPPGCGCSWCRRHAGVRTRCARRLSSLQCPSGSTAAHPEVPCPILGAKRERPHGRGCGQTRPTYPHTNAVIWAYTACQRPCTRGGGVRDEEAGGLRRWIPVGRSRSASRPPRLRSVAVIRSPERPAGWKGVDPRPDEERPGRGREDCAQQQRCTVAAGLSRCIGDDPGYQ